MKKLLLLLFLFTGFLQAQHTANNPKKLSPSQLQQDFDICVQSLQNVHPAFYQYTSKAKLNSLSDSIKKHVLTDSMTADEFHIITRKYIAKIGCGHTVALPSKQWYADQRSNAKFLPFEVFLIDEKLFVKNSHKDDSQLTDGVEIISINGISTAEILKEMRSIEAGDGITLSFKNNKIERFFRTYYLFIYGSSSLFKLEVLDANNQVTSLTTPYRNELKKNPSAENAPIYTTLVEGSNAAFGISLKDSTVGILDIDGFSRKGYKKFYKKIFKEASKRDLQHLVIDLRTNGGGYFPNGNRLMAYLMEEPFTMDFARPNTKVEKSENLSLPFFSKLTKAGFNLMPDRNKQDTNRNYSIGYKPRKKNHWDRETYVLTDGGVFSMGGYVATVAKAQCNATVIGSETGGGEEGSNAILMYNLDLPNSEIRIYLPYYHLHHGVKPELEGHGVMPHIKTQYTLEDKLQGRDLEMEEFYKLLESTKE